MKFLFAFAFLPTALLVASAHAQVRIEPAAPKAQAPVRVQVTGNGGSDFGGSPYFDFRRVRVAMANNRIVVTTVLVGSPASVPHTPHLDLPIGQFPAGNYQVEVRIERHTGEEAGTVGTAAFTVGEKSTVDPISNLTDLWWNPDESGWGVFVVQHPSGVVFASAFMYDDDGSPGWYVMPEGRVIGEGAGFLGNLYRTTGPTHCFRDDPCPRPFDPARVTATQVGRMALSLSTFDHNVMWMDLFMGDKIFSRRLVRQSF